MHAHRNNKQVFVFRRWDLATLDRTFSQVNGEADIFFLYVCLTVKEQRAKETLALFVSSAEKRHQLKIYKHTNTQTHRFRERERE